jgi:hypothetical protein
LACAQVRPEFRRRDAHPDDRPGGIARVGLARGACRISCSALQILQSQKKAGPRGPANLRGEAVLRGVRRQGELCPHTGRRAACIT